MESQEVNTQRAASSNTGSFCTRISEIDGSDGNNGSDDSTSSGGCSDRTSWDEHADVDGDPQFDGAKVVDIDYDDDYSYRGDDVRRLSADNSNGNEEESDVGTSAGTTISKPVKYAAWKEEHTPKMATINQTSHLIRGVEVDSTCCWGGVDEDQVITDVRIVMAIDSMPDTRLVLLNLDEEYVKTASFYNMQKLSSMATARTEATREEFSVVPRQDSTGLNVSGKSKPGTQMKEENSPPYEGPQSRQVEGSCKEDICKTNHEDINGLAKFKKRRLFPILRSDALESPVMGEDYNFAPALSKSKPKSLGKEACSVSGHAAQIRSRTVSSLHCSAFPKLFSPRTAEQLRAKEGLIDQVPSHRHCEACKLRGHRLHSRSSPGLRTTTESSNVTPRSGNKTDQSAHQTSYQPYKQRECFAQELTIGPDKQSASQNKSGKTDAQVNTRKALAPYKRTSREPDRSIEVANNMAFPDLKENSSQCGSLAGEGDKLSSPACHGSHPKLMSSSHTPKPTNGHSATWDTTGNKKAEKVEPARKRISSFSHGLQRMSNTPVTIQSHIQLEVEAQNPMARLNRSLSPEVSPGIWVRSRGFDSAYSPFQEPGQVMLESNPTLINDEGRLEIYFADNVASGTYLIEIEADVTLSAPDSNGWRGFAIPGLLPLQKTEVPSLISFRVQRALFSANSSEPQPVEDLDYSSLIQAQFNAERLFDLGISSATQISGKFHLSTSMILQLRLKIPMYELTSWNSLNLLRTFPQWSHKYGLQVEHHVSMTVVALDQDIFAEQVKYSFFVKNGFGYAIEYTLHLGECLIELGDTNWQDGTTETYAKVTVVRPLEDLAKPLEVSFTMCYPKMDQLMIRLPTLSPKDGSVISERILLAKPPRRLLVEHPESGSFSTWKRMGLHEGQLQDTCFDRIDLPRLFPEGLKDDIVLRITELLPVCFRALQCEGNPFIPEEPSNLVWNLQLNVDKVFGGDLECSMSFHTQVGSSDQVLTVDPNDWTPDLFITGGQPATESVGEWQKHRNGDITLLKLPEMRERQIIEIALRWNKMILREKVRSDDGEQSKIEYLLPKIIGKSILGGTLRCHVDAELQISRNGRSRDEPWQFSSDLNEKQIRLPKLHPGYDIGLSFLGTSNQSARSIRFDDEQPKNVCVEAMSSENHQLCFDSQAEIKQTAPGESYVPDSEPHIFHLRSHEQILSWVQYSFHLAWNVIRCAFTPFLLICAIQFAVSRITHAWRPVEIVDFSSANERHPTGTGFRSMLHLGSLAIAQPWPESDDRTGSDMGVSETRELLPSHMPEYQMDPESVEITENETAPASSTDPGHGQPTAGGMSVMDWIDRALGWKNMAQ